MTNSTIPNVPRELLERASNLAFQTQHYPLHEELRTLLSAPSSANHVEDVRAMVDAPSPAGVEGLEVVGVRVTSDGFGSYIADSAMGMPATFPGEVREPLCRLSSASSIIIGLQEKIERLQFSLEVAKTDGLRGEVADLLSMLATVSKAGLRVRTERDQHAQRIGELEGLLREARLMTFVVNSGQSGVLRGQIDAAMSAGKDYDQ